MSVLYCNFCGKYIDTDFDIEHYVTDDLDYCVEEEEYDLKQKEDEKTTI